MRLLCISLFFFHSILVYAEEKKPEGVKVNCRLLSLDGASAPPPLITASGEGAEINCKVPTSALSQSISCFAVNNSISFVSAADHKPVAVATVPANVKSAILIFVAGGGSPTALPWRVFVIEDTSKNFPDGGAFVANFHTQDIRFVIGGSKLMLHPGGFHGVPMPEKRDEFNMAPVAFQFQQGEIWRDASESMLRFLPGIRYLVFAYVDGASGRPRISTFQDFKAPTPEVASP